MTTLTASGDPDETGKARALDGTEEIRPPDDTGGARRVGGAGRVDEVGRIGEVGRIARAGEPAWIYALAGWLLAVTQVDSGARGASEAEIRRRLPCGALGELDGDLDTMTVRALRRLPAIGPARALAIARARWEDGLTGGPESWDAIRGIGPETVEAIRRHLAEAAIRRQPPEAPIRPHLSEADGAGAKGPPAPGAAVQAVHGSEPAAESRARF